MAETIFAAYLPGIPSDMKGTKNLLISSSVPFFIIYYMFHTDYNERDKIWNYLNTESVRSKCEKRFHTFTILAHRNSLFNGLLFWQPRSFKIMKLPTNIVAKFFLLRFRHRARGHLVLKDLCLKRKWGIFASTFTGSFIALKYISIILYYSWWSIVLYYITTLCNHTHFTSILDESHLHISKNEVWQKSMF